MSRTESTLFLRNVERRHLFGVNNGLLVTIHYSMDWGVFGKSNAKP